jgi:NTE family protein
MLETLLEGLPRRRPGIALCLSGGGFRSALFHLGALRRLRETRLLHRVALVSSVSGGSILSGFFAERVANAGAIQSAEEFARWLDAVDWDREIASPFRRLTRSDLRTWPVVKHALWNWALPGFRVRHLERSYRRHVSERPLRDLPKWPEFALCATDLTFGVNWAFTREGAGDYQVGYLVEAAEWPLARAIAASSAFPPIFGPISIRVGRESYRRGRYRGKDRDRLVSRVALSDGGVYDNLGLEPAWKRYATVLVSDCGAPFGFTAGTNPIRRLLRYTAVVMNQAASVRKRSFFYQRRLSDFTGTYWGIRSAADENEEDETGPLPEAAVGYPRDLVDGFIAAIRTDLDPFTEAEQKILENHGYFACTRSLSRHLTDPKPDEAPVRPPHPEWLEEDRVRRALATSGKRISIRRSIQVLRERFSGPDPTPPRPGA